MDMEIILISALVCATIGALIAPSKNRRPIEGALWGGLLGVIGLLVLACLRKMPEPQRR